MQEKPPVRTLNLLHALSRWAWLVLLCALLMGVAAVYYAFHRLSFRTNRGDLVASDQRLVQLGDQLQEKFGSRDNLVVVVENGKPERSIAFAEALAVELRKYPEEFPEIFYRVDPERFKPWAFLYLDSKDLAHFQEKLLSHRRIVATLTGDPSLSRFYQVVNEEITQSMISQLFTSFLEEDGDEEKITGLQLLTGTLKQLHRSLRGEEGKVSAFQGFFPKGLEDLSQEGYFFTENDKYLLFLVTPKETDYTTSIRNLALLRQIVERVKGSFPGIQVGVTGLSALEDDEMASALGDITLATWLSLAGQLILLILFLRSFRRTLMEGLVLVVGLCWTFAVATLVIGHLNLLSMIFAPLMLGLTIDYGIHWFCRLEEEQAHDGRCQVEHLSCTMQRATPGIVYAALAAALSFFPLVLAGFKGLAELGLILVFGILLMLVATLVLLPSLVLLLERCAPGRPQGDCAGQPRPFLSLSWGRPGLIVALGLGFMALGGVSLRYVSFDLNPLNLQNKKTESVVWELKLLQDSRYSTAFGAMVAGSLEELTAKSEALKKLSTVSHVESILSFLPQEVDSKRRRLQELQPVFSGVEFPASLSAHSRPEELAGVLGRIRFKLAQASDAEWQPEDRATQEQVREASRLLGQIIPLLDPKVNPQGPARLAAFEKKFIQDLKDHWQLVRDNLNAPPPRLEDLPQEVRQRFVGADGSFLIRVFPAQDIWDPEPLARFVQDLRQVDADVVGDPVLLHVFTLAFRNACLWAAGIAVLAVTCLMLLMFRSFKLTFLALLPLFVGTGWTLNLMWLLGIPFNQANVLFLPLILGEGIEFGIIILVRWRMEESARAITLPASTAKGVLLAALTTTVGFGSLMVSGHQGTFSLGLLATVGSLSVLLASLSVLPAFLRLLEGRQARKAPGPGFWRWLTQSIRKEVQ
ncbi:MAG: rRNA methyltransferase [Deltaproteobacteria bacterium]|nr:rRNA methyltransferase [Deltaproteobacteria bacterium]